MMMWILQLAPAVTHRAARSKSATDLLIRVYMTLNKLPQRRLNSADRIDASCSALAVGCSCAWYKPAAVGSIVGRYQLFADVNVRHACTMPA